MPPAKPGRSTPSDVEVPVEDQLRLQARLLAAIQDSVIFTNLEGRIVYWNRGAEELFGYTADEIMGQTPAILYPFADPAALEADLKQIRAGEPYTGTWQGRRKDGATVWLDVKTTLVQDADGTPIGFLGLAKDATERMAGLTRQLLAFSRQQVLQPQTLDLNTAVVEGWNLLGRLIGTRIETALELASEPMWINADPSQLLQVLMNLALNARDAMPEGGQLTVYTGRHEVTSAESPRAGADPISPGHYVMLSVRDSGTGIAPEHLPNLFEPLFTTKSVGQGTGLGLATVHGIVTQSDGHIWVDSVLGQGTTFVVLFPEAPAGTASASLFRSLDPKNRPARVLVVDDDEMVRSILARSLEAERYDVLQAGNAHEALDQLARAGDGVDLVLSDVIMPGMGRREFSERLAAEHPSVLVAFMSGYARDLLTEEGVTAAVPFLQKPISPDVLVNTIRDILARRGVPGGR